MLKHVKLGPMNESGGTALLYRVCVYSFKSVLYLVLFACITSCAVSLSLYHISQTFSDAEAFENIVGKGENAVNQHFLLFPTKFSTMSPLQINSM